MDWAKRKVKEFRPTPGMRLYAFQRARLGDKAKNTEISKLIGIQAQTISTWLPIKGYPEWLEEQVAVYRAPILEILEQIAINKLEHDYRYWEAMAKKYGFIQPEGAEPPKAPGPDDGWTPEKWAAFSASLQSGKVDDPEPKASATTEKGKP